jgi:hypothetical protein
VSEVGPYTYRERRPKWDISFTADHKLCSYRYNRTFEFMSAVSEPQTDVIWQFDQYLLGIIWTFQLLRQQEGVYGAPGLGFGGCFCARGCIGVHACCSCLKPSTCVIRRPEPFPCLAGDPFVTVATTAPQVVPA